MSQLLFRDIKITNFKAFNGSHEFTLDRKPGVYYITGQNRLEPALGANGVGKSSLFDALFWCLWGKTIRDNRPAAAITPWDRKVSTLVSVTFRRGDVEYILDRGRSPNKLVLFEDGRDGRTIEQEDVPALLGMSEEMFRRTVVIGQFGTFFMDLKPEQQAQMFTEALGLDVWLKAVEAAGNAGKLAEREATSAASTMVAVEALLEHSQTQLKVQQAKAELFEKDKAARLRKGEAGITQLESDLSAAQEAAPSKPVPADDTELRDLERKSIPLNNKARDALRAFNDAGAKADDLADELADLKKPDPICPTCAQPMSKQLTAKRKAELEAKLSEAKKSIVLLKAANDVAHAERTKLTNLIEVSEQRYRAAKAQYLPLFGKYEDAIRKIASIQGELKRWRDTLRVVKAETNEAADEVVKIKAQRSQWRGQLTDLKFNHETALATVETAKFWQDGFREIRLSIIDQTLLELQMAAGRHAAVLGLEDWGVQFDTERETQSGKVNYAFTVLLFPPGQTEPVKWESYSGGESQRWQLAVAFALSEVLLARAGLAPNLEVLDEPTRGLSTAGVGDLIEHLRDRALELGRAIYFVDHHSLDKGSFDATLMVTKDKKGSTFKWQ